MMRFIKIIFILAIAVAAIWAYRIGGIMAVAGLFLSGFSFYKLLCQENTWFPVGEISLSMGAWQWIIAPLISYSMPSVMYPMSQPCSEYMLYTVPLYGCMLISYYVFKQDIDCNISDFRNKFSECKYLAKYFIVIGVICSVIPFIPVFNQVKVFLSFLFYCGIILLMITNPQKSVLYFSIAFAIALISAIRSAGFHTFVVWTMFMLFMLFALKSVKVKSRIIILVVCLLAVNTLQTVKFIYRPVLHSGSYKGTTMQLFMQTWLNVTINQGPESEDLPDNISRFNQGWIISKTYDYIPKQHDYFYGRTIKDAFVSALIPRFLMPHKKGSTTDDFIEMTGYNLQSNTSMGLSVLGESYGNFGLLGGCVFMFLWGWFIAKILSAIGRWYKNNNFLWIIFMPMICFNIVKAEQSFMSVFNWTVKGVIFAFLIIFIVNGFLPSMNASARRIK